MVYFAWVDISPWWYNRDTLFLLSQKCWTLYPTVSQVNNWWIHSIQHQNTSLLHFFWTSLKRCITYDSVSSTVWMKSWIIQKCPWISEYLSNCYVLLLIQLKYALDLAWTHCWLALYEPELTLIRACWNVQYRRQLDFLKVFSNWTFVRSKDTEQTERERWKKGTISSFLVSENSGWSLINIPFHFKPSNMLRQKLFYRKDETLRHNHSNVVYPVQCSQDCTNLFIGDDKTTSP